MQSSFQIKPYDELSRDELYDILAARFEVFVIEQRCFYTDPDYQDHASYHLMVRNEDNVLQAYLRIIPPSVGSHGEGDSNVHIGRVLCRKDFRGCGLGMRVMKEGVAFAQNKWPMCDIELSAQTYVASLYQKFGFESSGEEYMDAGVPHIRMIRKALA